MARIEEITQALVDLGLTKTEAEVYTELLRLTADGPVSSYKVAQTMGRDPANMSKTLMGLETRGAVRIEQEKPRLFAPVPPPEFTEERVLRIRAQRRKVVKLLEGIGGKIIGDQVYTLRNRTQVVDHCRRLLSNCTNTVLLDCSAGLLDDLRGDIEEAVRKRQINVLLRTTTPCEIAGTRVVVDPLADLNMSLCPGPWIHLVADGQGLVNAYLAPDDEESVLQAIWSNSPFLSFHNHCSLGAEIVLAAIRQLVAEQATPARIRARERELTSLVYHQIDWEDRWQGLGLARPKFAPVRETRPALPPQPTQPTPETQPVSPPVTTPGSTPGGDFVPAPVAGPRGDTLGPDVRVAESTPAQPPTPASVEKIGLGVPRPRRELDDSPKREKSDGGLQFIHQNKKKRETRRDSD